MRLSKINWGNWGIFVLLSFIWGSSFILMKLGLYGPSGQPVLSPYHVAALRLLSAGIVLIPFAAKAITKIPRNKLGYVILSGLLGSFFPAFLFCIAETKIDSVVTGTLNSLTPVFVIITGLILYNTKVAAKKILGVLVALTGCVLLLLTKKSDVNSNIAFAGFVLIATLLYGINTNMVRHELQEVSSLNIAAVAFVSLIIPSLAVLLFTRYFSLPLLQATYIRAGIASIVLGIAGTAIASILFYMLVKRAGPVFTSMVTYGIPIVAILWGLLYGEQITFLQVLSLGVILAGVFLANK